MNEVSQLNIELVRMIKEWDPLSIGVDDYDTEAADVVQLVHQLDDVAELGKEIQAIYHFSYEEVIPLSKCEQLAAQLLVLKNTSSCER
ncbi:DUF1871 family protein [Guptibacillus sedimenti]|uniref:DUF1871 family protein n=1 Tax=Guptibacillus sedimenti TaxID=3025680 RepID=UPI0023609C3A|nr:DUF1871 family protein [Pseudalkalibacillus sedimenti]